MTAHTLRAVDLPPRSDGAVAAGFPVPSGPAATVVTLPSPPSTNRLWKNKPGGGRAESSAYVDWKGHAGWVVRSQAPRPVHGRVLVVLSIEHVGGTADVDNRVKAIFDLLVKEGVMDDDRNVVAFCIAWAPPASKLARVMILPIADYTFDFILSPDRKTGGWFPRPADDGAGGHAVEFAPPQEMQECP